MDYLRKLNDEYKTIDIRNIGYMLIQGDSFYFDKVLQILQYLKDLGITLVDYEFKQIFFESDREEMYLNNLNNQKNYWWFGKRVFDFGPTIGLFLRKDNVSDIFGYLAMIKGKSDPRVNSGPSIRNDIGAMCVAYNLIHTSDNYEDMIRESSILFSANRVMKLAYKTNEKYEDLRREVSIWRNTKDYSVYQHFLLVVMHRMLTFYRNHMIDYFDKAEWICKLNTKEGFLIDERQLLIMANQIREFIIEEDTERKYILFLAFVEYLLKILHKQLNDFNWEIFWDLCEINEIKISAENSMIITAGKTFDSF